MDNRRFQTVAEVKEFFCFAYSGVPNYFNKKDADAGILIDTKLRREILTGDQSDRVAVNGRVRTFKFEDLKGGVWRCKLGE